jgi:hypothetical protein
VSFTTKKDFFQHFNTSPRPRTITQISTPLYKHIIANHIRETPTPCKNILGRKTRSTPSTTEN